MLLSKSLVLVLVVLFILTALIVSYVSQKHYNESFLTVDINPADFGGKNERTGGTQATFNSGDYIDLRNTNGYFASTYPTGGNPFGYRVQAMANTLCFYGYDTPILYAEIDPKSTSAFFIMRPQGDAIIVSTDGKILWSTETTTGTLITFSEDGDIIVFDANFQVAWQQSSVPPFSKTAFKKIP